MTVCEHGLAASGGVLHLGRRESIVGPVDPNLTAAFLCAGE
jgi:hypothetical protein